ncbi:MAG: hypothetical protein K9I94_07230 [Bacteroidales bacterium]|nr:hypothetical protein [Bacteroidales bacterium]
MEQQPLCRENIKHISWIDKFHILSLDIALGTLGGGALAKTVTQVSLPLTYWIILPLTVWAIYTTDHLIDGLKVKENAKTLRHYFHYIHAKKLAVAGALSATIAISLAIAYFNILLIYFGLGLGMVVLLYFVVIKISENKQYWLFQKEFTIAFAYTAGIWGAPVIIAHFNLNLIEWLMIGVFFLIALSNLLLFSWFEYDVDKNSNFKSFVRMIGKQNTTVILRYVFLTVLIVELTLTVKLFNDAGNTAPAIILLMMTVVLSTLFLAPKFFVKKHKYRFAGDCIFILPIMLLI